MAANGSSMQAPITDHARAAALNHLHGLAGTTLSREAHLTCSDASWLEGTSGKFPWMSSADAHVNGQLLQGQAHDPYAAPKRFGFLTTGPVRAAVLGDAEQVFPNNPHYRTSMVACGVENEILLFSDLEAGPDVGMAPRGTGYSEPPDSLHLKDAMRGRLVVHVRARLSLLDADFVAAVLFTRLGAFSTSWALGAVPNGASAADLAAADLAGWTARGWRQA